jgi:serine-type D-Ala-D-Ala carboxypeptidase (penicillin-binding protein 5/6)
LEILWRLSGILTLAGVFAIAPARPAMASHVRHHRHHSYSGTAPMYHAALLVDADSGSVLYAQNPSMQWPPASMAKMMMLLVAADQIRAGRVTVNDPVRISERAATTGGSRLGLREGQVYSLGELMKAALIRSANDAAVAVAEKVGGSVEGCVHMMNEKARALGMNDTYYGTVDGLPPRPAHDVDHTSALDLAILARALIHTTNLLQWSSMEMAPFNNGQIMLHNTNHLVGHFEGCDGLKTGFTMKAGFNLTATAQRGDMRLISVILGAPSNPERFIQSARLLTWGFDTFAKVQVLKRGEPLPVHVQVQSGGLIQPVSESDISLVLPKSQTSSLKLEYSVPPVVIGPVTYGESLGQVIVMNGGEVMTKVDAICPLAAGEPPHQLEATTVTGSSNNNGIVSAATVPSRQIPAGTASVATVPVSANPIQENR